MTFWAVAGLLAVTAPVAAAAPTIQHDEHFEVLIADAKAAMMGDPKQVIAKATVADRYADTLPASSGRAVMKVTAEWLRGEAYVRLNDLKAAQPLIAHALAEVRRLSPDSKLHGDILLSSGGLNTQAVNVAKALADYHEAHRIFQKLGEVRSQAKALQSIGMLYAGGNDFANALKYYDQAIAVYDGDPNLRYSLFNSRGNVLKELGRYTEAERQYDEALALARDMKSPLLQMITLGNIAESALADDDIVLADKVLASGLSLSPSSDTMFYRQRLYGIAAQAAFQRRQFPRAVDLITRRFVGLDLAQTSLDDREAHLTAYRVYSATGRDDLALKHLVALKRLDDEATNLARSTNSALMGARFDFANQELKIVKLKADEAQRSAAFERARAQTQRYVFLGAAGATAVIIALLLFGIVTIRRSRDKVRAANGDLAVTNVALGKALAAKTEFLATTSHEIRTPLNGILGMTQVMLADSTLASTTRDRLKIVHGAGTTMKALVDDILDVAKMETGNLTIEDAPFDLKATIFESTRLWEDQARAKGIAFACDLSACPGMIQGDAARVRQVTFNLLSNALKFTAEGEVTLTVAAAGDRYRIAVRDTGVGILADKLDDIFESFRQADTSTTRQFGGTGLGLSICRSLARAMDGDVSVTSEVGAGSVFTVDLPLRAVDSVVAVARVEAAPALLIVDRNPITRAMLKTWMAPHVDRVEIAGSIDDALEIVARDDIARILIDDAVVRGDNMMAETARFIATGAPVVLLFAGLDEAGCEALAAAGVAQVIAKPVNGAGLVAALKSGVAPLVSRAA